MQLPEGNLHSPHSYQRNTLLTLNSVAMVNRSSAQFESIQRNDNPFAEGDAGDYGDSNGTSAITIIIIIIFIIIRLMISFLQQLQ